MSQLMWWEGGVGLPIPVDLTFTLEAILVMVGFFWYALNRRARNRRLKVRLATASLTEIGGVGAFVEDALRSHPSNEDLVPLPRGVYDGLVSSTNIAYFDGDVQKKLHELYYNIRLYNETAFPQQFGAGEGIRVPPRGALEDLLGFVNTANTAVEQFRDRHRYRGRWLAILKVVHWEYDG